MRFLPYLVFGGAAGLVAATALMIIVRIVHAWWPVVPPMPFTTACALTAVSSFSAFLVGFLTILPKELTKER